MLSCNKLEKKKNNVERKKCILYYKTFYLKKPADLQIVDDYIVHRDVRIFIQQYKNTHSLAEFTGIFLQSYIYSYYELYLVHATKSYI